MKEKLNGLLPHILVILAFIVVSVVYFYPVLEGKDLLQGDDINAKGMAQEITQFEKNTGEYSAWTNSMFGGMPSYQIKSPESFNIHLMLQRFLHLFLPYSTMAIFFVYLLGFYLLLCSLKFKRGIAVIGALAFALSSYNIIIIAAGHITKCYAIAYMAPVIAGIIHCYNKEYIKGFFLTAFALGIEIACNHPQIVYYLAILCGVFVVYKAITTYMDSKKEASDTTAQGAWKAFGKATAIAAIAAVFAVLPNITNLWTTWEYGKYSTRSQSELSSKQETSGLDKDYAMAWSYGKMESFNLMIPDFKGGANGALDQDALSSISNNEMRNAAARMCDHYWGDQPFTSGPVYLGAIIVFLFVLGMFIVKSSAKWWMLAATILSLLMSWGHNIEWFTDFMFKYFPLYNKFRSPSMALVIAQVCVPFLAMIAIKEIQESKNFLNENKQKLWMSLGLTAGLCALFYVAPGLSGSFISDNEQAQLAQIIDQNPEAAAQYQMLFDSFETARKSIFRSDAMRSIIFIVLAGLVIIINDKAKLKPSLFFSIMGLLIVIDLWSVDRRYLGNDHFKQGVEVNNVFRPSAADQFIMKDTDPDFRVLNLTRNVFNDGQTSYFHKSIGGYHGAKMRRYQEFIDTLLAPTVNYAKAVAEQAPEQFGTMVANNNVLNMLNTKFIILNPQQSPYINMDAYGHAWFVNKFDMVETADQEIASMKRQNTRQTAVINKTKFKDYMANMPKDQIVAEDSSVIVLTKYQPNYISYDADAKRDRLAVFSEIYYPKGWQAYIDGKEVDHICADYILRALVVPAGQHKIEFRFDPTSVRVGKIIAAIASSLLILALLAYLYKVYVMDKKKEN